ncbi:hypothetical protein ACFFX0_26455 [Citricoccus parietis]|uniref:Uncharacterized protein n=1 Tax=Citricoccus parietis TaxID=592307 RepID=A0ABV5G6L8_9MICC
MGAVGQGLAGQSGLVGFGLVDLVEALGVLHVIPPRSHVLTLIIPSPEVPVSADRAGLLTRLPTTSPAAPGAPGPIPSVPTAAGNQWWAVGSAVVTMTVPQ